ncbi:MAG: hypothetical protein RIQ88_1060 [Actinomycetota bacterium]|jgi:shikimate dehydrogenase
MTKHSAVVGDPISQSLSPIIHDAAYKYLGLDRDYSAFRVPSGSLNNFLISNPTVDSVSVTMPLKFEAFTLSLPQGIAIKTGVVNTLLRTVDQTLGFNTDVFGLAKAIEKANLENVLILGTGATARSAVESVRLRFPEALLSIAGRSAEKLDSIASDVRKYPLESLPSGFSFVINTIPNFQVEASNFINTAYFQDEQLQSGQISGTLMLIWQAIGQLRVLINGSPEIALPDEDSIFEVMRSSIA